MLSPPGCLPTPEDDLLHRPAGMFQQQKLARVAAGPTEMSANTSQGTCIHAIRSEPKPIRRAATSNMLRGPSQGCAPQISLNRADAEEQLDRTIAASGTHYGEMIETLFTERLCERNRMSRSDIWRLRKQFNEVDEDRKNSITMAEFFHLIHEERRGLSNLILRLASIPPTQTKLSFDEYVSCVCQFASFNDSDLLRFFFNAYTSDAKRGVMQESDIQDLAGALQKMQVSYKRNITTMKRTATTRGASLLTSEAAITLDDFEWLARHHMIAFYPIQRLQRNVRSSTLGEVYWVKKAAEDAEIDAVVQYMRQHHGLAPPMTWTQRLVSIFSPTETRADFIRRHARQKYLELKLGS